MKLKGPLQNEQEMQDVKQRISLMEENISSDPDFALQGVKFASLFKPMPMKTACPCFLSTRAQGMS